MHKRSCSQCGAGFKVPYRSTRRQRCKRCRYRGRKTRADRGVRKANWITLTCANCEREFQRPPHYVQRRPLGWRFYCGLRCRDACAGQNTGRPPSGRPLAQHHDGYVVVYLRPEDRPSGQKHRNRFLEHRVVMARTLGRELLPSETVHHIDGDKTNNAPENLQLRIGRHGKGSHYRCRACGSTDIEAVSFKES